MTVHELIEALQKCDPDLPVHRGQHGPIGDLVGMAGIVEAVQCDTAALGRIVMLFENRVVVSL